MSSFSMNLIYLMVVILVPILPAFILFKFISSAAEGQSPVKGIIFKFTGAFAGYAFVFLLLFFKLPNEFRVDAETEEIWEVKGKIVDATGAPLDPNSRPNVEVIPMPVSILPNGDFSMKLVATKNNKSAILNYCIKAKDDANIYLQSNVTATLTSYINDSCNKSICIADLRMPVNPALFSAKVDTLQILNNIP